MKDSENRLIILALKRTITATFTPEKWKELGYLTNTSEQINQHPRLLRSLNWGDSDYPEHVFWAIEMMIEADPRNIDVIIDFVKPKDWLKDNDAQLYSQLYVKNHVNLEEIEKTANILDIAELNRQAERIKKSITEDPELAIGSTKELLETIFKTILGQYGQESKEDDFPTLWKKVQALLDLSFNLFQDKIPGSKSLRKLRGSLNQIVYSIVEIRNLYGTGHGKARSKVLEQAEVKLVVNSGIVLATFILEKWKRKQTEEKRFIPF